MNKITFSLKDTDFFTYLNDIGFYDFNELKKFKNEQNPDNIENIVLRCLYYIGIGKSATVEGDLRTAHTCYKKAFHIADEFIEEIKGDYLAFLLYEYSLYIGGMGNHPDRLRLLKRGQVHAKSPVLKLYFKYGITLNQTKRNLKPIIKVVDELRQKNLIKTHAVGLQRIGIKYGILGQYDKAEEYYIQSLRLAEKHEIIHLIHNIYNSIGLISVRKGKYENAIKWFSQHVENVRSHYTRVLMTENIGYAYFKMEQYDQALSWFQKAFAMAKAHNVISQLPEQCRYIADCYENLDQIEKAHLFYRQGYDIALDQADMGLGLYGTRKTAVKSYVDFMDRNSTLQNINLRESIAFRFSLGKSWNETFALFQYHLVVFHLSETQNMDTFYSRMDMNPTTFYAIKTRLATYGLNLPSIKDEDKMIPDDIRLDILVIYIEKYLELKTWKEANQVFENDIFMFLFKYHRYSRNKIAESLQVTYPTVHKKVAVAIEAEVF